MSTFIKTIVLFLLSMSSTALAQISPDEATAKLKAAQAAHLAERAKPAQINAGDIEDMRRQIKQLQTENDRLKKKLELAEASLGKRYWAEVEIADAMRTRMPIKGMTVKQAIATFGEPVGTETNKNGEVQLTWEEREVIHETPRVTVTGTALEQYAAMQSAVMAGPRPVRTRLARRVTILFSSELAVAFSDQHYE